MKKIKILMLNYEFPPLGGGAGNATQYLLREFRKHKDIEIDLVSSSSDTEKIYQFSDNIRIHLLDIGKKGKNLHHQSITNLLKYSYKCYKYCKKIKQQKEYDICHAFFGIPCGFIAIKLQLPFVVSLRGSDIPFYNRRFILLDFFVFKYLSKYIWSKARKITVLSEDSKRMAEKIWKKGRYNVIYNGIDTKEFVPRVPRRKSAFFEVLFVGRLIERKGVEYLLQAIANIHNKKNKIKLTIVGTGPKLETFRATVNQLKISEIVEFRGLIPHNMLTPIYQDADVIVIPSLNEALGNVTLESMACGLPVITTPTGAAELITDNGIIVRKESVLDTEKAISLLMKDQFKRDKFSKNSRKHAENMDWNSIAQQYFCMYKKATREVTDSEHHNCN